MIFEIWISCLVSVIVDWCATAFYTVYVSVYLSEVRAPIPQKQDILVEPEPLFGGITLLLFFL